MLIFLLQIQGKMPCIIQLARQVKWVKEQKS